MAATLFLRLEAPLQAWGERARWSVRDTAPEPTKSGVVGLLGCALGIAADAPLAELAAALRMGVRLDRPGQRLSDYQTVSGGVMSAEGKVKSNANTGKPETVVSPREYLADASFLVALQGADALIDRLARAVQNPVWTVYLGRKCCPPARPLYAGTGDYPDLPAALASQPLEGGAPGERARTILAVIEVDGRANAVRRRDQTGSNRHRTFLPRYTRDVPLSVTVREEAADVPF
jgi:CRISPR system Cascade subunit CasD